MSDNTFMPAAVERGRTINPVALAEEARFALSTTTNPAEIMQIEAKLDAVERLMRETGLYPLAEIRLVNEERMRARWCLGAALESVVNDTRAKAAGGYFSRADAIPKADCVAAIARSLVRSASRWNGCIRVSTRTAALSCSAVVGSIVGHASAMKPLTPSMTETPIALQLPMN